MLAAVAISLCLIGAAAVVGSSFDKIIDKEMTKYGANVILKSNSVGHIEDENVPLYIKKLKINGKDVSVAEGSIQYLLKINPAWLVKGRTNILVGKTAASKLNLKAGQATEINGVKGMIAVFESGTDFDSFIFINKKANSPNMFLIKTNNPMKYKGMNAVILEEMVRTKYAVIESIKKLMVFIALISAIASITAVINLCRVDTAGRRKEFGIFKSLGASYKSIWKLIGSEFSLLAVISFIIGFAGSILLSWLVINYTAHTMISVNLQSLIIIGITSLLSFSFAAMVFIIESKRLHIVEELKSE